MADAASPETPQSRRGDAPTDNGSVLCTRCGLCCMGVVHYTAALDPEEIPRATAQGLPVKAGEHRPAFSLPCPRLEGTICGIYAERPNACRRYRCQLLLDVDAGSVPVGDAQARITEARRLLDELRTAVPDHLPYQQARRAALSKSPASAAAESGLTLEDALSIKLRATALDLYVDRFFRRPKDRKSFELTTLGEVETKA
jgi:hypothetical protein